MTHIQTKTGITRTSTALVGLQLCGQELLVHGFMAFLGSVQSLEVSLKRRKAQTRWMCELCEK